jgi:hypothetical protein
MLKSRSTTSTSDSQNCHQVRPRNEEAEEKEKKELPFVIGIGKHIFVYRIDRGKWRVETQEFCRTPTGGI